MSFIPPGGGLIQASVGLTNPLTSDLDAGNFNVENTNDTQTTSLGVDTIALRVGSLLTRVAVQDAMEFQSATPTVFYNSAPQTNVAPTVDDDLCNKAYVDSHGGGGATGPTGPAGENAVGVFAYSTSFPHPVDSWYENSFNSWAFSNNGIASNQNWINSVASAQQSLKPVYITLVQGSSTQTVKVVSVAPDLNFTYITYLSAVIPPLWIAGAPTTAYVSIGGADGANGAQGPEGPTGPAGPFSQALANKILVDEVSDPAGGVVNLTWSTGNPASQYVPLYPSTTTTTLAPINPGSTGTGWRFSKTYTLLTVSSSPAPITMITGATYTIITPSNVIWTDLGAANNNAGTQFTYNGHPTITGNNGTVYASTKISWYALNALYPFLSTIPPALPTMIVPSIAIKKKNLRNAWFLVKMNSDVAQQGSFAIQIETYAYQFGGNGQNDYTGRWAYSLPLQQGVGFSAGATTNITTGTSTPRLRNGFTYLLYAGDISPAILPNGGLTFLQGGSGLFAPSQVSTENTLRDPYNFYTNYPHLGLTSSSYVANATQPAYGGSSPYTDPADVEVASIYLNTSSTSPPSGTGQTIMDFNVLAFGYSGYVDSSASEQTFSFTTQWI